MSDKGWIKSHRSIITSSVWDLSHAAYRVASYLIHMANRKPGRWGGMDLDAGDCIRSYRTISEDCRVAKSHAQKIVKRLQQIDFIRVRKGVRGQQIITICNWEKYQNPEDAEGTAPGTLIGTLVGTLVGTEQEGREVKKEENKSKRVLFAPPKLADLDAHAVEKGWHDFDSHAFLDHYESNGWKVGKNPMKSWRAAASGWHRRQKEYQGNNGSGTQPKPNLTPTYRELIERDQK